MRDSGGESVNRNRNVQKITTGGTTVNGPVIQGDGDIFVEEPRETYSMGDIYGYNRENKILRSIYTHVPEDRRRKVFSIAKIIGLVGSIASIIGLSQKFTSGSFHVFANPIFILIVLVPMAIFFISYVLQNPDKQHKCPECGSPYSIKLEFLNIPEDSDMYTIRGYHHKWCSVHGCGYENKKKEQFSRDTI